MSILLDIIMFDWKAARILGRLHVLTKVSYLTILMVPMIASVWPVIDWFMSAPQRILGNQLDRIIQKLDATIVATGNVGYLGNQLAQSKIESIIRELCILSARLGEIKDDNHLPGVFVAAFFAALFVVVGNLLYDLFAPYVIKSESDEEYSNRRASEYLESTSGLYLEQAKSDLREAPEKTGPSEQSPKLLLRELEKAEETCDAEKIRSVGSDCVREASKMQYQLLARKSVTSLSCNVCYYVSIITTVLVVLTQAMNVLSAAGWFG